VAFGSIPAAHDQGSSMTHKERSAKVTSFWRVNAPKGAAGVVHCAGFHLSWLEVDSSAQEHVSRRVFGA
jgi:hypothetical protein